MISSYDYERVMGIDFFISNSKPLLGVIKYKSEDFVVEEIMQDGTTLYYDAHIKFNLPNKGDYLYLAICKRNITSTDVAVAIARKFRLRISNIGMSGIKDRRAVAVQCFSVKGLEEKDLEAFKFKKFKVLAFSRAYGPLRLGHHLGNNFRIIIRNVKLKEEEISSIVSAIKQLAFIPNYFGYQRFGIPRPVTHKVGEALVKGYYEKAVDELVANIDPLEPEEHIQARKIYMTTHDPAETLKYLPEELFYERIVLEHLLHYPGDYARALSKLPATALRLFVESYSSYLFNKFLSLRLSEGLGNDVEEGDLLSPLDKETPVFFAVRTGESITRTKAISLHKEGKLAIVLPVLGYRVKLSGGFMGDLERELLIDEGVRPQDFKVWLNNKYIGLKGSYRRIDLKLHRGIEYGIFEDSILGGKAVLVSFALYKGSYATTLLREIMKHPFAGAYFGKLPS